MLQNVRHSSPRAGAKELRQPPSRSGPPAGVGRLPAYAIGRDPRSPSSREAGPQVALYGPVRGAGNAGLRPDDASADQGLREPGLFAIYGTFFAVNREWLGTEAA